MIRSFDIYDANQSVLSENDPLFSQFFSDPESRLSSSKDGLFSALQIFGFDPNVGRCPYVYAGEKSVVCQVYGTQTDRAETSNDRYEDIFDESFRHVLNTGETVCNIVNINIDQGSDVKSINYRRAAWRINIGIMGDVVGVLTSFCNGPGISGAKHGGEITPIYPDQELIFRNIAGSPSPLVD